VAEPEGAPQVVGRMPKAPARAARAARVRLAGVPRWRRVGAALGGVGVAAVAIGIVVVTTLPGSSQGASPAAKSSGSTTVQRRDLVATDTESGTLSYANPQTVFNRLSGTITSLPNVGQLVKPGQTLYHVSGAPVVLFDGTTPAYRDLTSGDSNGPDILQLNRDLRSLGFDPDHQIALNDTWQDATTTAVESWQSSLGETETGTVTLGQIVFLPGPQVITSVDTNLGSTGGASSGSGVSATSTADTNLTPHAEFVSLTTAASAPSPSAAGDAPPASTGVTTPTDAAAPCPQPVVSPSATGTPTTTTAAPTSSCEKTGNQTTTTETTTTPTTPTTTTTTSTTPTGPPANIPTKPTSGSRSPSEQAILLALLKAETLELKKSLSASGGASRSAAGASGSTSSGSSSSGGRGGSGGFGGSSGGGGGGGSSSASVSSGASSGGGASSGSASGGASTAQAILQTTSNQLVVTVDLDATKQSEAVVGEPVTVELPNGNTVNAKIIEVSPVAQTSSSSTSSGSGSGGGSTGSTSAPTATIPVTIKITGRHPAAGLDQAAVSVNFEQQVEKNVLSVPVTALLATAGGGYAVQEAAAPHTLIAVTPGLFAAGYVQISGSQIYPGLQVTDSQG
jgi:hypothetical protein